MPPTPAINRFHKLIDDISRLYIKARNAQVQFGWETGRLVEEEQDGEMQAEYGSGLMLRFKNLWAHRFDWGK